MISKITIKKIRRGIKYPVLIALIHLFVLIARFTSRKLLLVICGSIGKIAYLVLKKERNKTLKNLTYVYGESLNEKRIWNIGRSVFIHHALNFADYLHTMHYTTRSQFNKIVEFEGEEHFSKAYEEGNGVICLMCHGGSWEFSAIMPSVMGYKTSAVSRAMPNEKIDKLIVGFREKRGLKNIRREKVYDRLVDLLKRGECLIIMIDQDTKVKGVFVDFFGKKAYTPVGAARLALDTKAAVLPMYINRLPNSKHRFTILPPLPLIHTGNTESDIFENTIIYTNAIEEMIKKSPEQWVWMHERWKTTPEDVEKFLQRKKEMESG